MDLDYYILGYNTFMWGNNFSLFRRPLLKNYPKQIAINLLNKKTNPRRFLQRGFYIVLFLSVDYIIPPMPPIPGCIGAAGASSFFSAITHSVVRNIPAIDAAFSRATRVTLAGSITPAARRFS